MKTILVLTDFSKLSKIALVYAIGIAKKMNGKIILLSVINASSSSNTLMNWKKIEEKMVKAAQEDADQFILEVKAIESKVDISYQSILGFPIEDTIDEFAVKNKVDFIVMGTKGATGLKKALIGSNTVAVMDSSSVPVIVVPAETPFKSIKKIVYATDIQNLQSEIKIIARFAQAFDAPIHVLNVVKDYSKKDSGKLERNMTQMAMEEKLIRTTKYSKIHFHVVQSEDTASAVDKFVKDQKADLLAMFTHRLDFYEKLFGKSITRQLAFHSKVPMLTFNKTNMKQGGIA